MDRRTGRLTRQSGEPTVPEICQRPRTVDTGIGSPRCSSFRARRPARRTSDLQDVKQLFTGYLEQRVLGVWWIARDSAKVVDQVRLLAGTLRCGTANLSV